MSIVGVGVPVNAAQLLHRTDERVDLHRPALVEVLEHRGAVRAHGRPPRRCAGPTSMGNFTPSFSAISWASSIMSRATARVPSSVQRTSSVAWVSAEIGLNERLPQSFTQISSRSLGRTGALRPAAVSAFDRATAAVGFRPVGLAEGEAVALDVLDDAGFDHLGGGARGRRRSRAHRSGAEAGPLRVAGVDRGEAGAFERAADLVEIPPGHAVHAPKRWSSRRR